MTVRHVQDQTAHSRTAAELQPLSRCCRAHAMDELRHRVLVSDRCLRTWRWLDWENREPTSVYARGNRHHVLCRTANDPAIEVIGANVIPKHMASSWHVLGLERHRHRCLSF